MYKLLVSLALFLFVSSVALAQDQNLFLVKPYIQLGNAPHLSKEESLCILWAAASTNKWSFEYKQSTEKNWQNDCSIQSKDISVSGLTPFKLYKVQLNKLIPGSDFDYHVLANGKISFVAQGHVRKAKDQPYKAIVFGDLAYGSPGQLKIAYQAYKQDPDLLVFPGDIVYGSGRISEYLQRYFPVYNSEQASVFNGGPLIRSALTIAAPGNHDLDIGAFDFAGNLNKFPDGLGYFIFWNQPLNGPITSKDCPNIPKLFGNTKDFLQAAGENYPRMANFSFDYGNTHWLILDANGYMDWTDTNLRTWVEKDLQSAKSSTWKFVVFHQPGFSSDKKHQKEQRMRLLSSIFEDNNVDIVFSGHTHNYQRTYPLNFKCESLSVQPDGTVKGAYTLDKDFDGNLNNKPKGVIYIITGAGGAKLSGIKCQNSPETWHPFTYKFIASTHSYTLVNVVNRNLEIKQISENGKILDNFSIKK